MNGEKVESCNKIKHGNGMLALEVHRILKNYFQDLYNIGTQKQVVGWTEGLVKAFPDGLAIW